MIIDKLIEKLYFRQPNNLALYDTLTGVYNYNWLNVVANEKYYSKRIFVTFIDVNSFKKLNDSFGHEKCNKILSDIATNLCSFSKYTRCEVIRYGGDEFIILTDNNSIKQYLNNNRLLSYGTVEKREDEPLFNAINRADKIMYKYKENLKKSGLFIDITKFSFI